MPESVSIIIDGQEIQAAAGTPVLQAALDNGIYIPHLCYHPDLTADGNCRLCTVKIKDGPNVISCVTPVSEGMDIITETEEIAETRKNTLELLLADHPKGCLTCSKNEFCELQKLASFIGVDEEKIERLRRPREELQVDTSNPFFNFDPNKCVLCGICVRTCDEIQNVNALGFANRGYKTVISTFGNKPFLESRCVSCGECVVRCPVGALAPKIHEKPSREVKTTCTYCGVGCGIYLGIRGDKVVSARGARENPASEGRLCVKGRFGFEFIDHPERLKTPLIRKNGELTESTWDEALDLIAEKLKQYRKDKFAALSSARCTNEENYVIQKFARAVMGTNNVDHCARLCHSPSVAGLAQSFGSGAMTNSISEINDVKCILAIGTNTTSTHPVIALRIKDAVRRGAKLIVANPKEIELCRHAHLHLRQVPGTDVPLMMGMMKVIIEEGLEDREFIKSRCENYDEFLQSVNAMDLDTCVKITNVPKKKIIEAARLFATNRPSSIFYSMGITQHSHGTDNVLATSNLTLLTGNVGRPSTGVNPLRGQNNVQGACDMGGLPNVYPGYQKVNIPAIKEKFEKAWGGELDAVPGLTHTEIFGSVHEGGIKAIYIVGENPVISEANSNHTMKALGLLDFLVVQDIFLTETGRYADVVLPAATFAEKNGTFTNTERRVQRVRKAVNPKGDAKADWWITSQIAQRMGYSGFEYESAEDIMKEIAALTPSYGGITYTRLENGGLQWPCPAEDHPGTRYLHKEKFATASGKGIFKPLVYKPPFELPDADYPLILTTDRSLYHYHTSTMTRRVKGLEVLHKEELMKIHPVDAEKYGIADGQMVTVSSRRGRVQVKAHVTDICPAGVVSMTFHFHESPTNELTSPAVDPVAKIPETKVCSVKVEA